MALIKCKDCNKEISEHASSCPHCGCPVELSKSSKSNEPKDMSAKSSTYVSDYNNDGIPDHKQNRGKKVIKTIIIMIIVVMMLGVVFVAANNFSLHNIKCTLFGCSEPIFDDLKELDVTKPYVTVVTEYINVREEPNIESYSYGKIYRDEMYNYTTVETVDGANWYKIQINDSTEGYVIDKYNGEQYLEVSNSYDDNISTTTSTSATKKPANSTIKPTMYTKITSKPTMKTTVIKPTSTKPTVKKYTIGTIEGINQEYAYSSNKYKCRLDSLSVKATTSEYSEYIKFEISSKMTKTRNDSSVIGYCSIVINFYDEANIKIGSTSASIGSLAVGETGIDDTFTYSSANLENITGSVIRVSVSPRA